MKLRAYLIRAVLGRIQFRGFLPVISYGCETWSQLLREEHRLRVFENRVRRRIFGPKREKVMGGWRKLHNEEVHNFYCSPNIITVTKPRMMRWQVM
jgi:hypothetical protein